MARSSYIYLVNRISNDDSRCKHHYVVGVWTVKHEMVKALTDLFANKVVELTVRRYRDGDMPNSGYLGVSYEDMTVEIQKVVGWETR